MKSLTGIIPSAFITGTIFALGILIIFLAQTLTGRALGITDFGIFSYVYAWITICSALATLGFDSAALRFVSHYYSSEKFNKVDGYIKYSSRWILSGVVSMMFIIILILVLISDINIWIIITASLCIPFWAGLRFESALLRGFQKEIWSLLPDRLFRELFLLGASILAILTMWTSYTALHAILALFTGTVIAHLLGLKLRYRARKFPDPDSIPDLTERRLWLKTAIGLCLAKAFEIVFTRLDVLILGTISSLDNVGTIAIALLLSNLILLPILAFNVVCIPRISALYHNGEHNALIELSKTFAKLSGSCALLIGLPILVAPDIIVSLLGDSFNTPATTYSLFWLAVSRLITIPLGPVAPLLAMTNNERYLVGNYITFTIIKIICLLIFVPAYGLTGAIWVSAISFTSLRFSMAFTVWRRIGFFPGIFAQGKITN